MFSGLAQHANHRDPPLALHDAPGPKAPDARRSLLACSAASNAKSPADTEARSSRPFRRQPVHTPHQQAAAQVAAGSSAGSPSCTGPFVPRPGSDVRRRPGGRPHDSRPAPAAQELQVRTGQRHPDPGGQPTRPVTRAGQAPIPGMHYRLPRHERLNLSRKAEMTRKITGIMQNRTSVSRMSPMRVGAPITPWRGAGGPRWRPGQRLSIRRDCASSLDKKLITAREHSRSPTHGGRGSRIPGIQVVVPLRRRATCHRGLLTGAPNWPDRRIPSAAVDLIRPAVLVQVLLAHGLRLGPRGVPDRAADVPRVSVGGGPGHAPRATL